jgi:hypothetical protein
MIIGFLVVALCVATGWNRAPWPTHLVIGAVAGAFDVWAGFNWWRQISGEEVAMITAASHVVSAMAATAAIYWIARWVRSMVKKRAM